MFGLCICAMACLSSMASVAAQGSDSHDAPPLFVLLCESSVRLCLPLSCSSRLVASEARSRSLPSPLLQTLSRSFIHSLIPIGHCRPPLSLLSLALSFTFLLNLRRNSPSLAHSILCHLPLFLKKNVNPLPGTVLFFLWLTLLWASLVTLLLSLTTYL